MKELLAGPLRVVNVGLEQFSADLRAAGVAVADVDWSPPSAAPCALALAERLESGAPLGDRVDAANREAVDRLLRGDPVLADVLPAEEVVPGMRDRLLLHAGPPVEWDRMCGPMRGAVAGAVVLEGWADDLGAAAALAAEGGLDFEPNHDHDAVGTMTGIITRSMPVMVVENRSFGNRAFCTLNEGLGKVMRFGGNDAEVRERLRWLDQVLGPALGAALRRLGGVPLKGIVARGLAAGDEMHQRNVACTGLLLRELAPALARGVEDRETLASILAFVAGNDQFFLNVAMALGKAIADPARGVPGSSVVTAMARNGTDFGIRLSGTGERWFTAPVEMPRGLYFPGFTEADANPDMGDSTIVETVGLGGFAMAAAPAVAGFVGAGSAAHAAEFTRRMYEVTCARNPEWTIPALEFAGVPSGIDARRVVASGIAPTINTGIAHREAGVGQVGAGVVRAPMDCFVQALAGLAETLPGRAEEAGE